jgi:cell division protease FtsH
MANALMKYETIDNKQIDQIMEGHEPDPPDGWQDSDEDVSGSAGGVAEPGDRTSVGGPAEQH